MSPRALAWSFLPIALTLGGCRAVLGIEDLEWVDGSTADASDTDAESAPATSSSSAGATSSGAGTSSASSLASVQDAEPTASEAGPSDDGGDRGGADASSPPPPNEAGPPPDAGCGGNSMMCVQCCVMQASMQAAQKIVGDAMMARCVCAAGSACQSTCSATLCSNTMPTMDCMTCVFNLLGAGQCPGAFPACQNDVTCAPLGGCLSGCSR